MYNLDYLAALGDPFWGKYRKKNRSATRVTDCSPLRARDPGFDVIQKEKPLRCAEYGFLFPPPYKSKLLIDISVGFARRSPPLK